MDQSWSPIGSHPARKLRAAMRVIGKEQRWRPQTRSDKMNNVRTDCRHTIRQHEVQFVEKSIVTARLGRSDRIEPHNIPVGEIDIIMRLARMRVS
jgi:hypothetical protein